jgi:proteasome lid subunit RPN8/RPN11
MVHQAQSELPNECCGLLAGRLDQGVGRVTRRYPLVNAAASPTEFESDAKSMFAAEKSRRLDGFEILAIYHSHPRSAPVPSRTDLARNYSPQVVNLIVSLQTEVPEIRGWWLNADSYREADVEWLEEKRSEED